MKGTYTTFSSHEKVILTLWVSGHPQNVPILETERWVSMEFLKKVIHTISSKMGYKLELLQWVNNTYI